MDGVEETPTLRSHFDLGHQSESNPAGIASSMGPAASPGLAAASQRQNTRQLGFRPDSILQQLSPSGNGMDQAGASRILYGSKIAGIPEQLPSMNGQSPSTYIASRPLASTTLNA